MGIIRILLAFSVLLGHSVFSGRLFPPGDVCVQLFFIISGFYMAMILNLKYKDHILPFFKNRILRLYPIYIVVVAAFLVASSTILPLLSNSSQTYDQSAVNFRLGRWNDISEGVSSGTLSVLSAILLVFSNLSMQFQDLMMFLRLDQGNLVFGQYQDSQPPVYTFLYIPQAWSLSVELAFYLCAPLLVRHRNLTIAAFSVSFLLRAVLHLSGLNNDPFSYRFFPSELSVFMLGALSWHLYSTFKSQGLQARAGTLLVGTVSVLVLWPEVFHLDDLQRYAFFVPFAFCIPYIFEKYKKNVFLNKIGEMSYPFYLVHALALLLANNIVLRFTAKSRIEEAATVVLASVLSLILSYVLIRFVQERFEKMRRKAVAGFSNDSEKCSPTPPST